MSILDRLLPRGFNEDENYPYFLSKEGRRTFFDALLWLHLLSVAAVIALAGLAVKVYQPPNSPSWIVGVMFFVLFTFILSVSLLINLYSDRVNDSRYKIIPRDLRKLVREALSQTEDPGLVPHLIGMKVLETVEASHKEYNNHLEGHLDMKIEHFGFKSLSLRRKLVTVAWWTFAVGAIFMGGAMIFGLVEPRANPTHDPRIDRLNSREADVILGLFSVLFGALAIYLERTVGRMRIGSHTEDAIEKLIKESQDS